MAPVKLNRYKDDILFYMFYTNVGDVLQLAAAAELYNRDWRYHKVKHCGMGVVNPADFKAIFYVYFDLNKKTKFSLYGIEIRRIYHPLVIL